MHLCITLIVRVVDHSMYTLNMQVGLILLALLLRICLTLAE